jgi:hypothetical protein
MALTALRLLEIVMRNRIGLVAMLMMIATAAPAWSQDVGGLTVDPTLNQLPLPQTTTPPARPGRIADSAAGQAGVRQTRAQVEGVNPMARINSRIQNRVQARLRNRIDRDYDPRANASSPFETAGEATGRTSQPR